MTAACLLYPGRTYCIRCGKCKEEEEWAAFREAVSNAMIKCLEAQGCRMVTLEEQMKILCDPARHIRREQSKVTILVENRNTEEKYV